MRHLVDVVPLWCDRAVHRIWRRQDRCSWDICPLLTQPGWCEIWYPRRPKLTASLPPAGASSAASGAAVGALSSAWLLSGAATRRLTRALSLNAALDSLNARLGALLDSKDSTELVMLLLLFVGLYAVLRRRRALRNLYGPPPGPITRHVATPAVSQQQPSAGASPPAGGAESGGGTQQQQQQQPSTAPAANPMAADGPPAEVTAADAAAARRAAAERAAAMAAARMRSRPAAVVPVEAAAQAPASAQVCDTCLWHVDLHRSCLSACHQQ